MMISPISISFEQATPHLSDAKCRSNSTVYPRSVLLSLATGPSNNIAPQPRRLSSFTPILRCPITPSSSSFILHSDYFILDGEPISKDLPIPPNSDEYGGIRHPCDISTRDNTSFDSQPFSDSQLGIRSGSISRSISRSIPELPVLLDFNNPFAVANQETPSELIGEIKTSPTPLGTPSSSNEKINESELVVKPIPIPIPIPISTASGSGINTNVNMNMTMTMKIGSGPLHRKLSSPFPSPPPRLQEHENNFPSSVNSSPGSRLSSLTMRLGPRVDLSSTLDDVSGNKEVSRSNSVSSITSSSHSSPPSLPIPLSRSSTLNEGAGGGNKLNPFAPPFPLPNSNGEQQKGKPITSSKIDREDSLDCNNQPPPSLPLPLPKQSLTLPLPSSLPARPGPLPPVFVKRESAALPQPMALPEVAPLGKGWMGDNSLSGNERRRRTSQVYPPSSSLQRADSPSRNGGGIKIKSGSIGGSAPNSRRGSMVDNDSNSRSSSPAFGRPDRLVQLGQRLRSESQSRSETRKW
ncbi:uncharacterized protein IL334_000124 [Kwoniella shivajii]|uniref:Uncharacterized protein n=1 Tax=Kwoniella shivajii TaxID=564305 RepID=A0ABZ1CN96_9TREE|nr:hypothetical protein IL334_000124 [Kwoniella shivajii]